ncbi:SET domain-containing protein [Nannizzia gypsea CBS 118893]|uniref:SET domain-containing protein n=1 Tax=Arthroderma gypseum (strain ATCC MYA-4604 / CBS 118893) TaxID=535722 RepID=E4V1D6_ARTGP|nr:SET domain-containing protein [Nannizzia gypsea CBS 118893]EFR03851.1 SET domain-containing protein [Nannizzia gypsea CBS 118893]
MANNRLKFDSPPATLSEKIEADKELANWITALGGGLDPTVEIHRDAERGACLRVRSSQSLDSSTVVARCPISATMSILNAKNLDPNLPPHDFHCSDRLSQGVRKTIILALFVAHQQLKEKGSHWWPYLATLPRASELTSALFYHGDDLEWLQGTNLYQTHQAYMNAVKEEYDSAISILRDEGCLAAELYSWDLFCWAYTVIASRAFTSRVLSVYLSRNPALKQDEEFQILLPLVDSSNHKPLAKIEWRAEAAEIGLKVVEPIVSEEEIHNNYGPLNNQQLMTTYGFCIVDNPCDFRDLNVNAPPGTPLANARQFRYQEFQEPQGKSPDNKCFLFNIFYPFSSELSTIEERIFSRDLLDALGLTRLNTRESQNIEVTEDRTYANFHDSGSRIVLNALCQGSAELAFRIIRIGRGGYLQKQPSNDKQKLAQIYRESEWLIYMTGLVVCEWAITRSRTSGSNDMETLLEKHLSYIPSPTVRERLRNVIKESNSIVPQQGELFLGNEILDLLDPSDTKVSVCEFINDISHTVDSLIDPSNRQLGPNTVTYILFLLICLRASKAIVSPISPGEQFHNTLAGIFPKRLDEYVVQLIDWYPLDDEQTIGDVLEEEVEKEIAVISKAIEEAKSRKSYGLILGPSDQWLSLDMLRWAAYVVQEEEVTVLRNPLEMVSKGASNEPVRMDTDNYFYVSQLPAST